MDRQFRQAMRGIISQGRVGEMVIELMQYMSNDDRLMLDRILRFHRERVSRTWNLLGQRIAICNLADSSIERLINESGCKRVLQNWDYYTQSRYNYGEDNYNRSIYTLIIEEAEYRGIISKDREYWERVIKDPAIAAERFITASCLKTKHDCVRVEEQGDEYYVCTECRERVSVGVIVSRARAELSHQLRGVRAERGG